MAESTEAKTTASPKRKTTARKAPAKRKTTARKAPAKRKTAAKKSTVRSNVRSVENKAAAYERKAKKASKDVEKSAGKFADRAQEAGRKAFLASLGFYGRAFDQAQEQFKSLQEQMEDRRAKASDLYAELVKRGEKVESDAKSAIDDIDLPRLEGLADRKALEAKLEQARERFNELKGSVSFKSAA